MDKDIIQLYIINNIDLCTLVTAGIYLLLRCSPILEYSPTALLVITIVGASTAFFAATCGLVANDLKRIIAMSTISQLGYSLIIITNFIFLNYIIAIFGTLFDFFLSHAYAAYAAYARVVGSPFVALIPLSATHSLCRVKASPAKLQSKGGELILMVPLLPFTSIESLNIKDIIFPSINNKNKFIYFSYAERSIIKKKYNKVPGIYLWVNNTNNKSYVGKSVNIYQRFSKYFSKYYINTNKQKMAICGAIDKYNINNFTLYILETFSTHNSLNLSLALAERENHWYDIIKPSYNIQTILQPFSGSNHYRFGKSVPDTVRSKISNTLKGRIV